MKKFDAAPVSDLKIQLIKDLLNNPVVNELWLQFIHLGNHGGSAKEREKVFQEYAHFRDMFLGLPALKLQPIQSEHRRRI